MICGNIRIFPKTIERTNTSQKEIFQLMTDNIRNNGYVVKDINHAKFEDYIKTHMDDNSIIKAPQIYSKHSLLFLFVPVFFLNEVKEKPLSFEKRKP